MSVVLFSKMYNACNPRPPCPDPTLLIRFCDELLNWNKKMNLTGARFAEDVINHILDSLMASALLPQKTEALVADIGSGNGFPGVPLALLRQDIDFVLIERIRKKAGFLRHVARNLNLQNVSIMEIDAHELIVSENRKFDVIISRAVKIKEAANLAMNLLKNSGQLIIFVSEKQRLPQEWRLEGEFKYEIPGFRQAKIVSLSKQGSSIKP